LCGPGGGGGAPLFLPALQPVTVNRARRCRPVWGEIKYSDADPQVVTSGMVTLTRMLPRESA